MTAAAEVVAGPDAPDAADAPDPAAGGGERWCLGTRLLVAATRIWVVFLLLGLLLGGRWWPWLLPTLAPPLVQLAVPLVLLALAPLARPVRRWLVPALALLVLVGATQAGVNWRALPPGGGQEPVPEGALRVFAWNTKYWDTADDSEEFYAYLRSRDADVYLLQEYLAWRHERPTPIDELDRVREEFPGYEIAVQGELVTLSRHPIVASPQVGRARGITDATPWVEVYERGKVLRTDVNVRGTVVSFYNVHIPVQVDLAENPLTAGFYTTIRGRDAQRRRDYADLAADAAASPHPVLIAGDFNTSPGMADIRGMQAAFHDAVSASTALLPVSWNNEGLELWRLDWAFTNDGLDVRRYAFEDSDGMSDHRAQHIVAALGGGS